MISLPPADEGSADHDPRLLGPGEDRIDDLGGGGTGDSGTTGGPVLAQVPAGWCPAPGVQQSEVVVDLGRGGNGRAGIMPAGSLLDGNGGREALDGLDIRLVQLVKELPGIGAE